jgi:hypothetical protein
LCCPVHVLCPSSTSLASSPLVGPPPLASPWPGTLGRVCLLALRVSIPWSNPMPRHSGLLSLSMPTHHKCTRCCESGEGSSWWPLYGAGPGTGAKGRAGRRPFWRFLGHAQSSLVSSPRLPLFLPARNAITLPQPLSKSCLSFQGSTRLPASVL